MKDSQKQAKLFDDEEVVKWKEHWKDMPEFVQNDLTPEQQILVSFKTRAEAKKFGEFIGQKITYKTKSIWWPKVENSIVNGLLYTSEDEPKTDENES